jgi:hypothetical protein
MDSVALVITYIGRPPMLFDVCSVWLLTFVPAGSKHRSGATSRKLLPTAFSPEACNGILRNQARQCDNLNQTGRAVLRRKASRPNGGEPPVDVQETATKAQRKEGWKE